MQDVVLAVDTKKDNLGEMKTVIEQLLSFAQSGSAAAAIQNGELTDKVSMRYISVMLVHFCLLC